MRKSHKASLFLAALLFSNVASAGLYTVERATIDDLSVIQVAMVGAHLAGNMEIKVRGGFTLPAGAGCADRVYITTLKTTDADKRLYAMLLSAQVTKQPVSLYITDDPTYTAAPGRCSLVAVSLVQ